MPLAVAVIVAEPLATPRTTPLETVATLLLEEVQVTVPLGVAVAVSVTLEPTCTEAEDRFSEILASALGVSFRSRPTCWAASSVKTLASISDS